MTAKRPKCVHCGDPYGRRATHLATVHWKLGEDAPPYKGNSILVRLHIVHRAGSHDGHGNIQGWYEVWDGESFSKPYEPFCTLRCALRYAREAHEKIRKGYLRYA